VAVGCRPTTGTSRQVVHITDQEPMLALMRSNILLNSLEDRVEASVYDWGAGKRPASVPAQPDVVLAADCVYFEPAFPLLLQTLEELIGPETVCYFCFKRRRRADMQFLKAARKAFVVVDVEDDPERESYAKANIFLYVMIRPRVAVRSACEPLNTEATYQTEPLGSSLMWRLADVPSGEEATGNGRATSRLTGSLARGGGFWHPCDRCARKVSKILYTLAGTV